MRTPVGVFLALLATVWAAAQTLPAKRSDNYDANARDGRFDLRARVDGSVDFYIRGAEIRYRLRNGRPPTDEGSEYRQELPRGPIEGLNLEQRDGRNPIRITEEPSRRNNWTLVLSIDDRQGGDSRYHARITWSGSATPGPFGDRPGGIGIGGQVREAFDRGRQVGADDARRGVARDYRRHGQEFDSRSERSFQRGYEEGYDSNRGSGSNLFDRGVERGSDDARRGLSRDHRRYNTEYDFRSERNFQQGYEQGYDANRGGDRTVIDRGYRLGSDDARRSLSRDYRRYTTEYDSRTEASFRSGYEQGYDAIRGSGSITGGGSSETREAYADGRRYGQRDAQDRLRPDYKRYSERYNSRTESEFRRGYQDGYYNRP